MKILIAVIFLLYMPILINASNLDLIVNDLIENKDKILHQNIKSKMHITIKRLKYRKTNMYLEIIFQETCSSSDLEFLKNLSLIKCLVLKNNGLKKIPYFVEHLINLTELNLKYNNIENISLNILALPSLKIIKLDYNKLKTLPLCLTSSCTYLSLRHNDLECFFNISKLQNLEYLDISNNDLFSILKSTLHISKFNESLNNIFSLKRLNTFYFRSNSLSSMPSSLNINLSMEKLDLSHNNLTDYRFLNHLPNVKELYLENNKIKIIPKELFILNKLQKLSLKMNEIKEVCFDEKNIMAKLEYLDLSDNNISTLDICGNFPCLKYFHLSNNRDDVILLKQDDADLQLLTCLNLKGTPLNPISISFINLVNLKTLVLKIHQKIFLHKLIKLHINLEELKVYLYITGVDKVKNYTYSFQQFSHLKSLKIFSFCDSGMETIPSNIFELKTLEDVSFINNRIRNIPDEIKKLENVRKLSFRKNFIETINPILFSLEKLEEIDLTDNLCLYFPQEIDLCKAKLIVKKNILERFGNQDQLGVYALESETAAQISMGDNIYKFFNEYTFDREQLDVSKASFSNIVFENLKIVPSTTKLDSKECIESFFRFTKKYKVIEKTERFYFFLNNLDYIEMHLIEDNFDKMRKYIFLNFQTIFSIMNQKDLSIDKVENVCELLDGVTRSNAFVQLWLIFKIYNVILDADEDFDIFMKSFIQSIKYKVILNLIKGENIKNRELFIMSLLSDSLRFPDLGKHRIEIKTVDERILCKDYLIYSFLKYFTPEFLKNEIENLKVKDSTKEKMLKLAFPKK